MQFIVTHREAIEFSLVVCGAILAVIAGLWLLALGVRVSRMRGPVALALFGILVAVAPYLIRVLDKSVVDLGRPVMILDSDLHLRLNSPTGSLDSSRSVKVEALVLVAGAALTVLALAWLFLRGVAAWPRSRSPFFLLLLALLLLATPLVANVLVPSSIDLGPHEQVVNGEMHLTLTGWDRNDYSVLQGKKQAAVLQMANSDVTDSTLDYLDGMTQLRELDLNNSQISDAGLEKLAKLPLKALRLANTKITDAGFNEHLAPLDSLQLLDLSGTTVKPESIDAWKKAKKGRKALR